MADKLSQVYRRCRQYWTSERTFVLAISILPKPEDDEERKWHKYGSYIGLSQPWKMEKLVKFNFIEVKPKIAQVSSHA